LIPHFEECPAGVIANFEFIFQEFDGMFSILTSAGFELIGNR
jgi:hypothetical protein